MPVNGSNFGTMSTDWGRDESGQVFIKKGSPRLTRIVNTSLPKSENVTNTASEVINPEWNSLQDPTAINTRLGNNGLLKIEMPGQLNITKSAQLAAGKNLDPSVLETATFKMQIKIDGAAGKKLEAVVKNAQGDIQGEPFELCFDAQGMAAHSIKNNETLSIFGIDANAAYEVTEVEIPQGFQETSKKGDTGAIAAGAISSAIFVNTYDATAASVSMADFGTYRKVFDRWDIAGSFDIVLTADDSASPMPAGSEDGVCLVKATEKNAEGTFGDGDVEFTKVGNYTYSIYERTPSTFIPGVSYSDAAYTVTVAVKDDGAGALTAETTMVQSSLDDGKEVEDPKPLDPKVATFTNTFSVSEIKVGPLAKKAYTNNGGPSHALVDGMFEFKVKPIGENAERAPLPDGLKPDDSGYVYVKNDGESVAFGQATFTEANVGKTYIYEISEVVPAGATEGNGYTYQGMTYDPTVYHAKFTVASEEGGVSGSDQPRVHVSISYAMQDGSPIEGDLPEFVNSYAPAAAVIEGDTALTVTKHLVGRNLKNGEAFDFTLVAGDDETTQALKDDVVVFGDNKREDAVVTTVDALDESRSGMATFGKMTFTMPGVYRFNIEEETPVVDGAGMTYDRHTAHVTVTVSDKDGQLVANAVYSNGAGKPTDTADFTNIYRASARLSDTMTLSASKVLNGNVGGQARGEFSFTVAGVDHEGSVSAAEANARMGKGDGSFSITTTVGVTAEKSGLLQGVSFTQDDVNKTFSYLVDEEAGDLAGITYDRNTYRLDITVGDYGNGSLYTEMKVMRVVDGMESLFGSYDSSVSEVSVTLPFTNDYTTQPVTVDFGEQAKLFKVLEGRDWLTSDHFEFTITSDKLTTPMPDFTTIEVKGRGKKAGEEVPVAFGSVTYRSTGVFEYEVRELVPSSPIEGITYSENVARIVVRVTDNGKGALEAKVSTSDTVFTNEYNSELNHNDAGGVVVSKVTHGHDMSKGQFQFQIEALDGEGVTAAEFAERIGIENGTTGVVGNKAGSDGEVVKMTNDTPLIFTQADDGKTFKFRMSEEGADGKFGTGGTADGYTFDDRTYTVEIAVVDNYDSTLELTTTVITSQPGKKDVVTTQKSSKDEPEPTILAFENSYKANGAFVPTVRKVLAGRNMKQGEFSFKLMTNPLDGTSAPTEVATATNDAAKAGEVAAIPFDELLYTLGDTNNELDLKKLADESTTGRYVEKGATADGNPQYTVHYTVAEVTDGLSDGNVTAETEPIDFTVVLTDNGDGKLEPAASYAEGLTFKNSYEWPAVEVEPSSFAGDVKKVLKGNRDTELTAGEFTFSMETEAVDGARLDDVTNGEGATWPEKVTAENGADGSVDFGTMYFSQAGRYKVTIKEVKGDDANVAYDGHAFTYTVEVTYDADKGELVASAADVTGSPTFTNVYTAPNAKDAHLEKAPQASVNGKLVGVGDKIVYTIDWVNNAVDESGEPAKAEVTITDKVPAGTKYVSADGGTHENGIVTWSLGEQDPGASGTVSFTVEVTEDAAAAGTVENTASIKIGNTDPKTTNKVVSNVPEKTVSKPEGQDDPIKVGDTVVYTISYKNGESAPATVTITDKLPEGVTFAAAQDGGAFDEASGTVTWTLGGVAPGAEGTVSFTAKVNESALKVDATKNTATVQVGKNGPVVSTNTTQIKVGTGSLKVSKQVVSTIEDVTAPKDTPFTFTVSLTDVSGAPLQGTYAYTGEGVEAGSIASGESIQLKSGQSVVIKGLPEGAKYAVEEAQVANYSTSSEGASGAIAKGSTVEAAFTNSYTPSPVVLGGDDAPVAAKELVGRDWLKSESYTVRISAVTEGAPMPASDSVTLSKKADEAAFGDIAYARPGTFEYRISEAGESGDENLAFSKAEYKLVVTVSAKGSELAVSSAMTQVRNDEGQETGTAVDNGTAVFRNTYEKPEQKKDVAQAANPGASVDGQLVQVGSELVYTIGWANDAVDDAGAAVPATVVITDEVPAGTAYVEGSADNGGEFRDGSVVWNLGERAANESGTVSFKVEVTDEALDTTVANTASVKIGQDAPVQTNTPEVFVPGKTVVGDSNGTAQVGDTLTYTVSYANLEDQPATVNITDELPEGLTYVDGTASDGGVYDEASRTLNWTLKDVKSKASGKVTFEAKVNEHAIIGTDPVTNQAMVQVGDNAAVNTNTTSTKVETGVLAVSKTVKVVESQGTQIDANKDFEFELDLADTSGAPLKGSYAINIAGVDTVIASGQTFKLKHGQSAQIGGLPQGTAYTVTEVNIPAGYTADAVEKKGVISNKMAAADFVNTYKAASVTLPAKDGMKALVELEGRPWKKSDAFTVELKALDGAPLPVVEGASTSTTANGDTVQKAATMDAKQVEFGSIEYTSAGTYTYEIEEIIGNIGGITYSRAKYRVTVKVVDEGDGTLSAAIANGYELLNKQDGSAVEPGDPTATDSVARFINTYEAVTEQPVSTDGLFSKVLNGRDWKESDSFTFVIEPQDGAPAPKEAEATLTSRTDEAGVSVSFGFGDIDFTFDSIKDVEPNAQGVRAKDFIYTVSESAGTIPGVTYDSHKATLTITITDAGDGILVPSFKLENETFVNTYGSGEIVVDEINTTGGVQVVKTLTGRAIAAGDFTFTMEPANENAQVKFGEAKSFQTLGAALGSNDDPNVSVETVRIATGLRFGLKDAGKTFMFNVFEVNGGKAGYDYDQRIHELEFAVADDTEGTLTVVVKLDGDVVATWSNTIAARSAAEVASIGFENVYDAGQITVGGDGEVDLSGNKILTGRPMVAGEFHFNVTNAKGDATKVVSTGTNDANGKVTFDGITYTTEQLNRDAAAGLATVDRSGDADVYTYVYTIAEDASRNDAGVEVVSGMQTVTVTVRDDRAGKLSAEVTYADGGMTFENAYGKGATAEVAINGSKVLSVESGDNAPNIEGKYTFTMSGSDGAPMPVVKTVTNDAAGNVAFGKIAYTMENVFGDSGAQTASVVRSKTFAYTVRESGKVAGVTNDETVKTITVTVTDNGDGTLSAVKKGESATTDFTFTNVYAVKPQESSPTGEDGFSITKRLDGRALREGEFEFMLVSQDEDMPEVVTALNDAEGNVEFPALTFSQPGVYTYALAEVDGELGGVTYDTSVYNVTATVTDNGDGTLSVAWDATKDGVAIESDGVVFTNTYKANHTSLSFAAAKLLSGRDIVEGEFAFELVEDGRVIATAKNEAPDSRGIAQVFFKEIAYSEAGEHDYTIREVKGDAEGVTYDETEFTYHVVVSDPGDGQLVVEWTEGENGAPVFKNTYTKPGEPTPAPEPSTPDDLAQTGDMMVAAVAAAAVAGIGAVGAGVRFRRKKN